MTEALLQEIEVEPVSGGEEALAIYPGFFSPLAVTDMKMPDGDGMWLISQIRDVLHQTPQIYLCSGYNDYTSEHIKELGIIKVFSKPFDFLNMVNEIIKHSQSE